MAAPAAVNPELSDRPKRRTFSAQEKLRILGEADRATEAGDIGALLRREGLYSSALTEWRRQREAGAFQALRPVKRGPKSAEANPLAAALAEMGRENSRLKRRLERAEAIIDLQKKLFGGAGDIPGADRQRRHDMMAAITARPELGLTKAACAAVGVARSSFYRRRAHLAQPPAEPRPRPRPDRALTAVERQAVLDLMREPRFADLAPAEIYASLLDQGLYYCSVRTMYRILDENSEVRERRNQLRHPEYKKPELLAEGPNQVWSWDITKLMGPAKWTYFYLYVIIDIFSRRIVGWCIADAENAALFKMLFEDATTKHQVPPGQLTLHADRGAPMKAKVTVQLLADLGVTKSHSRPHVSNDNPFSESHFKTLKYQPTFPKRFGCIEDARAFCRNFFTWYNQEHHHAGIGLMTPDQVHYGQADAVHAARQLVLDGAFSKNPERFVKKMPNPPAKPTAAWINPPLKTANCQA
ncbi:MAG: IS3 family transposase [Rhodospirillaceae bacterium]